jgi:pyruvate/2-oxoglutarate dehydrogenase complex dihydrolipoamide dehydrogenase (E3) component/uncharacterized membrane protein YdjX (TVP38/TMEM64 family)
MSRTAGFDWRRWALLAVIVAVIVLVWRSGLLAELDLDQLKARQQALNDWVAARPWQAAGLYFAIYVLVTALSIPGAAVMTLAGGAIFGLLTGTLLVSFASSIGASLAYLASRFVLRDALRQRYAQQMRRFDAGIERDGAFYLFTLRLVPLFPFFVVNVLAGLSAIRLGTFYWVSQAGMLPATVAFVYAGTQLAQLQSLGDVLSPGLIAAFVIIGLLPLAMRWLLRALQARRALRGQRRPRRFDYNLIAIGAGSAGLVSAYIGAAVKAKVALVERHRMGGDCLNTGCVPSKALIRTSRLLAEARDSAHYGVRRMQVDFDFTEAMQRVQQVIAKVEPHDSVERYRGLGVDVIQGDARFVSPWEIEVDGRRISARSIVIATGARPRVPDLPGLDQVTYFTSDTIWNLRTLPKRLLVLGGGPIGCELAQCFARLGSKVTLVQKGPRLLPREDADAAEALQARLQREGLELALGHRAVRISPDGDGGVLHCAVGAGEVAIDFDTLLLALGRQPNTEGLGIEALGLRIASNGTVETDDFQRSTLPHILVAGDVAGPYQFTHVASHQAWYASLNGLLAPFWSFRADYRVIPWATFTEPEIARVGLSEDEARAQGIDYELTRYGIDDLDRAIADGADEGFVQVLTVPGRDRILGATIVGAHAGELIHEFVLAMRHGLGLNKLLSTIHIYPTFSEANKYAAGNWKRAHAPATALRMAERFFAWRRGHQGQRPQA